MVIKFLGQTYVVYSIQFVSGNVIVTYLDSGNSNVPKFVILSNKEFRDTCTIPGEGK